VDSHRNYCHRCYPVTFPLGLLQRIGQRAEPGQDAWAQIDVQLNGVMTSSPTWWKQLKVIEFERDTLEAVTKARTAAQTASTSGDVGARSAAEGELSGALSRLMVVV